MRLVIEDAEGTRSTVPFATDEILIGRAAEGMTFRLRERNISRRHARFVRAGGAVFVEDLGSRTGTRVNGERIAARRRLREGDLIEIGDYDLAILPDGDSPSPGTPPPLPLPPVTPPAASAGPAAARAPAAPGAWPEPASGPIPRPRRTLVLAAALLLLGLLAGLAVGLGGR